MPKNRKPRAPDHSQSPRQKLSRRAMLSGLGIGLVARRLRAGDVEPASAGGKETPPPWVESLAKCTAKYVAQPGWNAEKEYRELKLLTLRMEELKINTVSVTRDVAATPVPAYQPKTGGKKP